MKENSVPHFRNTVCIVFSENQSYSHNLKKKKKEKPTQNKQKGQLVQLPSPSLVLPSAPIQPACVHGCLLKYEIAFLSAL